MRPNLLPMKPGPRPPQPAESALSAQVRQLNQQIQQQQMTIMQQAQLLQEGERRFRDVLSRGNFLAAHMAALLIEKHKSCAFIPPVAVESMQVAQQQNNFGGFDIETVGPDAVGPQRLRMRYMTPEECRQMQQKDLEEARAAHAAAEAAAAPEPAPASALCTGPWHQSASAPGNVCPKCHLSFPRES